MEKLVIIAGAELYVPAQLLADNEWVIVSRDWNAEYKDLTTVCLGTCDTAALEGCKYVYSIDFEEVNSFSQAWDALPDYMARSSDGRIVWPSQWVNNLEYWIRLWEAYILNIPQGSIKPVVGVTPGFCNTLPEEVPGLIITPIVDDEVHDIDITGEIRKVEGASEDGFRNALRVVLTDDRIHVGDRWVTSISEVLQRPLRDRLFVQLGDDPLNHLANFRIFMGMEPHCDEALGEESFQAAYDEMNVNDLLATAAQRHMADKEIEDEANSPKGQGRDIDDDLPPNQDWIEPSDDEIAKACIDDEKKATAHQHKDIDIVSASEQFQNLQDDTFLNRLDAVRERKKMGLAKKALIGFWLLFFLCTAALVYLASLVPDFMQYNVISRAVTDYRPCTIRFPNDEIIEGEREYSYTYTQLFGFRWNDTTTVAEKTFLTVNTGGLTAIASDGNGASEIKKVEMGEVKRLELPNYPQYTFMQGDQVVVLKYSAFCR